MRITGEIERVTRATIRAWAEALRRCLVLVAVAAATMLTVQLILAALLFVTR
jgi:hypothetical protein